MKDSIVGFKYKIIEKIGHGSFGTVYKGMNMFTLENVAIKTELHKSKKKILKHETQICKYLGKIDGIPRVRWFGKELEYLYTVYDLLGKDLVYYKINNKKIGLTDINKIGEQLLERIELIHKKEIIHRDLKPDNVVMDLENKGKVYIIDFGLAKKYKNDGKHIDFKENKSIVGSQNFCSYNVMNGYECSRRDDLISIGYILLYLFYDKLPWEDDSLSDILKKKKLENVLSGNNSLDSYLKYCYSLKFIETPNYKKLRDLFDLNDNISCLKYKLQLT